MNLVKKKLVINADDYGMTESISAGILQAHIDGIVNSVSIVSNTESFEQAVSKIKDVEVDTGIHLTLNSGRPLSTAIRIPILKKDGTFWTTPLRAPFSYFYLSSEEEKWVKNEFRRQIEMLSDAGINITHLDSHYHIHVFPAMVKIVRELVDEFKIPYVRKPAEPELIKRVFNPFHGCVSFFAVQNIATVNAHSLPFYGLTLAGRINHDVLLSILRSISTENSEIMVHPGFNSSENLKYYPQGVNHFEKEFNALVHPGVKSALGTCAIKLVLRNMI
ncbi:MAG: ChbG/HpnK family deacetylase [Candidatus Omnitrophota bacterium]